MAAIVFYVGDEMKGADILAAHAAGVKPYWVNFENGWYRLDDLNSGPIGPFLHREVAEAPSYWDEKAKDRREEFRAEDEANARGEMG
jgi:hypothetical protein